MLRLGCPESSEDCNHLGNRRVGRGRKAEPVSQIWWGLHSGFETAARDRREGAGRRVAVQLLVTRVGLSWPMARYIRPRRPAASVFFTLCLADRRSDLLTRQIGALRSAVVATLLARPVMVEAWVVLPDHMHFVWTLPEGDSGYSERIGAMKARFSMAMRRAGSPRRPRSVGAMAG